MQGRTSPFELLARAGYIARGAVYLLVGYIAVLAAIGSRQPSDTNGALLEILRQPFGRFLLAALAVGLVGYAGWRLAQAWFDLDGDGTGLRGIAVRGARLASGVIHLSLAFAAATLALRGYGGGGDPARDWTARLLAQPFGRALVAAVGLAIVGAAVAHFARAYRASFRRHLRAPPDRMRLICRIGRVGFAAKGVVFLVIGGFFLQAAWQRDPSESGGLREALQSLEAQPYGPWLLGAVAVGLFAFGLYSVIEAFYRYLPGLEGTKAGAVPGGRKAV